MSTVGECYRWRMAPKVGSGVVQSSAWAKALTKRCDAINQYLERCVINERQISTTMQEKGTAEKEDLMPRPIKEKLVKRLESLADMHFSRRLFSNLSLYLNKQSD